MPRENAGHRQRRRGPRNRVGEEVMTIAVPLFAVVAVAVAGGSPVVAQDADELRIVQTFELQSLEPRTAGWRLRSAGVVESIVSATPEGQIVPGLAESWTVS